jgi:hypothetical protein
MGGNDVGRALRDPHDRLGGRTDGFKPSADVNLRMRLTAEMTGNRAVGGVQVPAKNGELLVSTFDHEPMSGMVTDDPANFALKFS